MGHDVAPAVRKCIICDQKKETGIDVCGEFICANCEQEMVRTDVQEPKYPVFVKRMRRIWLAGHRQS